MAAWMAQALSKRRALALVVALCFAMGVAASAIGFVACDSAQSHIYAARIFEVDRDCLDAYGAVDVVSGGEVPSTCPVVCLSNAGITYVSTVCPPYPSLFGVEQADAAISDTCKVALAAYDRHDTCLPDGGGSSHPLDAGEGGTTSDSGTGADAGTDDAAPDAIADALSDAASD
jgi:hypothetical protein